MSSENKQYFELLKGEVVRTLQQSHPGVGDDISDWKGQTIFTLQEDMLDRVNDQVSEKWFYNHMKSHSHNLPRVDILNLLSRYTGYTDWQDFKYQHKNTLPDEVPDRSGRVLVVVPLIVVGVLGAFFLGFKLMSHKTYQFCFVSMDNSQITPTEVHVDILNEGQSPRTLISDQNGCIPVKTDKIRLRFVVSSPYYKSDTIDRVLKKFSRSETVRLRTDDYALMLHYFSTANAEDWSKRRAQLDLMLADSARIYEVFNDDDLLGLELYDKWEFINKLSVPVQSLDDIDVLDTEYADDKIVTLRFTQGKTAK